MSGGIVAVFAPAAVVDSLQDSAHRVVLCLLADMFAKGAFGFRGVVCKRPSEKSDMISDDLFIVSFIFYF